MTRFTNFEEFQSAAEELARIRPDDVRLVSKYRNIDGKLSVRVTDDNVSLQFSTTERQEVNKIERFSLQFQQLVAGAVPPS